MVKIAHTIHDLAQLSLFRLCRFCSLSQLMSGLTEALRDQYAALQRDKSIIDMNPTATNFYARANVYLHAGLGVVKCERLHDPGTLTRTPASTENLGLWLRAVIIQLRKRCLVVQGWSPWGEGCRSVDWSMGGGLEAHNGNHI